VALTARSKPDLEETARLVEAAGGRAIVMPTDIVRYPAVETLMRTVVASFGRVDIVVNNAGIARPKPLAETSPEEWQGVVDVNLTGVFNVCRAAAQYLIGQGRGKVINVASVLGAVGLPGYAVYGATKGGIIALTRTLGVEWARHNVQVNAIAPGWFVTEMNAVAFSNPTIAARLTRDIPARRTGRPEEIGPLAVYLASSASDFMTGQTIFLDGGHSAA
jgi:NAD(P)-dependent dehydrogenase (short-subunit alcohol dehydrogenase family)